MLICNRCNSAPSRSKKDRRCKACRSKAERANYNPVKDRARHIKYWYGITADDYERMYEAQKGLCALCEVFKIQLCIDHCHVTGAVRGLLCTRCNSLLGVVDANPTVLERIKDYRERN